MSTLLSILFLCVAYTLGAVSLCLLFPALPFSKAVAVLVLFALAHTAKVLAGLMVKS